MQIKFKLKTTEMEKATSTGKREGDREKREKHEKNNCGPSGGLEAS